MSQKTLWQCWQRLGRRMRLNVSLHHSQEVCAWNRASKRRQPGSVAKSSGRLPYLLRGSTAADWASNRSTTSR